MMDTKYEADSRIADSNRGYQMMQAQFDQEVNAKVILLIHIYSADIRSDTLHSIIFS